MFSQRCMGNKKGDNKKSFFSALLTRHWLQLCPVTRRLQKQSPLTGSQWELPDTVPLGSHLHAKVDQLKKERINEYQEKNIPEKSSSNRLRSKSAEPFNSLWTWTKKTKTVLWIVKVYVQKSGVSKIFAKNIILLFSKDAFNSSKVTVKILEDKIIIFLIYSVLFKFLLIQHPGEKYIFDLNEHKKLLRTLKKSYRHQTFELLVISMLLYILLFIIHFLYVYI